MNSKDIRSGFIDFFKTKGHQIVNSAPMVVKNDPTLMFTNAGMNQFKDIFLGNSGIEHSRMANSQKCLRVSGKHNDLEEVGHDTYHHTMFEMLGNWSFGDYFKDEAIAWGYEFLVDVLGVDKEKLYVTIFEGSEKDKLERDNDAFEFWKRYFPEERILNGSKKDNFWEMGDVGPCGPCTEIHIDIRDEEERKKVDGKSLVNKGHPHVIEIWNLVFIQYNRKANGDLMPLPAKHVDTGMGFERLCMVIQEKKSNYDTDVFQPLIRKIEDICGLHYRPDLEEDNHKQAAMINIAMRVISDHIRAISFSIADGQLPSNTGAGYVIRRILRRAVRYGYQSLNLSEPFLYRLVSVLTFHLGSAYPELKIQKELIEKVIKEEEISFYRTLSTGLKRIDEFCIRQVNEQKKSPVIDGKTVFELYDTYGFPIDLTALIARGYGLELDETGFRKELEMQKNRSRQAAEVQSEDWVILKDGPTTEFVGYDELQAWVNILRYREISQKGKRYFQLVFDKTPFYAEGGGQVGDTGTIANKEESIVIFNTRQENNLILHFCIQLPAHLTAPFEAKIDSDKRILIACNHSATHLMHWALRKVLGTHVEQKGSLVNSKNLRFDFSHFQKMEDEEILQVEQLVNQMVRRNIHLVEKRECPIKEAEKMGAMALFGEKYGEKVRVIKFDESVELCGGIHVDYTGRIGLFKIVSESAIAAGIRRIEAITSESSEIWIREQLTIVKDIQHYFKSSKNLPESVKSLMDANTLLTKQVEGYGKEKVRYLKADLKKSLIKIGDLNVIISKVDVDSAGLIKDLSFQMKGEIDNLFLVIGSEAENKAIISIMISQNLVDQQQLNANELIKLISKDIEGGGGGQPYYATAGGKNPKGVDNALNTLRKRVGV